MKLSEPKAVLVGVGLLTVAHVGWNIAYGVGHYSEMLGWLLRIFVVGSAFAASYLAANRKMIVGMSMVVWGTMLTLIANWLLQVQGHSVDFPGLRGALAMLLPLFLVYVILSAIGTAAGIWLSRRHSGHAASASGE